MAARALGSRAPAGLVLGAAVILLAVAIFPFVVRGSFPLFLATQIGVFYLVALGLNVLAGYGGQTSLGHGALVAIGAYTTAILTVDYGVSFWPALVASLVLTALSGGVMALPALRLSNWYFALVTLGFASVASSLLVEWRGLTHGFAGIVGVPAPRLGGWSLGPREMFWLVALTALAAFWLTRNLLASRYGRALLALRDNPLAATGSGVALTRLKLETFVFSAGLAGLAGAFLAVQKTVITPDDFLPDFSIFFLLVIVFGGMGRLHGPALGTAAFFVLPELLSALQTWRLMVYGALLLLLILFAPAGLAGLIDLARARLVRRRLPDAFGAPPPAPDLPKVTGASLTVRDVTKRFGGVVALSDVSLTLTPGTIHGIVGPNGSGKTTLLNVVSGFYPVESGEVRIDDVPVRGNDPAAIAIRGVRRTFQTPKLVPELSVLDNVLLGSFSDERASVLSLALRTGAARREADERRAEALAYLRFVGLDTRADVPGGDITHGQQRLAEIARALVGRPRLLLLDEPAAGLSMTELDDLSRLIRAISELGTTVVIVEHHLELVGSLCPGVTVLDRGRILASGTPAAVFRDPAVMAAYMGSRPLAEAA